MLQVACIHPLVPEGDPSRQIVDGPDHQRVGAESNSRHPCSLGSWQTSPGCSSGSDCFAPGTRLPASEASVAHIALKLKLFRKGRLGGVVPTGLRMRLDIGEPGARNESEAGGTGRDEGIVAIETERIALAELRVGQYS